MPLWMVFLLLLSSPVSPAAALPPALPTLSASAAQPSASGPTSTASSPRPPAKRPLDYYPSWFRPLLKYGVGGVIAGWFVFGLGSLCWRRWRSARGSKERAAARGWLFGMALGIFLSLVVLGIGFMLSLRDRQMDVLFWIGAPLAVLLPPVLARLLSHFVSRGVADDPETGSPGDLGTDPIARSPQ